MVSIILGKFKNKEVACRVAACSHPGRRAFTVPAEKRTDVQIALQMLEDAYEDRCDLFVLVSGDSDLVPAVRRVLDKFPDKRVSWSMFPLATPIEEPPPNSAMPQPNPVHFRSICSGFRSFPPACPTVRVAS